MLPFLIGFFDEEGMIFSEFNKGEEKVNECIVSGDVVTVQCEAEENVIVVRV